MAGGALVAVAAGLAAALLFVLAARGSFLTLLLGYFAPLPVMVGAISYGLSVGAGAALVGALFIAAFFHPALGAMFLLAIGAPAALIAAAAVLAPNAGEPRRDASPVYAVAGAALVSFATVAAVVGILTWRFGGFQPLLTQAIADAAPLVKQMLGDSHASGPVNAEELTRFLVLAAPVALVVSQLLMLVFNLWLAGRIAVISGNLPRVWPSLADDLVLPPAFAVAFAVAGGLVFVGGLTGALAGALAAALGASFALQGLAVAHVLTRGASMRYALLFSLYALIVMLPPWPFCLLGFVGLIDAAFHLRTRKSASNPPNV
jgi:hypothetical protein